MWLQCQQCSRARRPIADVTLRLAMQQPGHDTTFKRRASRLLSPAPKWRRTSPCGPLPLLKRPRCPGPTAQAPLLPVVHMGFR